METNSTSFRGGLYHVIVRGNQGNRAFLDRDDHLKCLQFLARALAEEGVTPYAYCLMPDHIHLLPEQIGDQALAKVMRRFLSGYTRYFNGRHQRSGNLFTRHQAVLVEKETYLRDLVRYILLNPVRSGLVKTPGEYPWTCYGAYAGTRSVGPVRPPVETALRLFGNNPRAGRQAFRDFIRAGLGEGHRTDLYPSGNNAVLGSAAFAEKAQQAVVPVAPRPKLIPMSLKDLWKALLKREGLDREPGGRRRSALEEEAAFLAVERLGVRQREIAEFFGLGQSGVSRAVGRVEKRWAAFPEEKACSSEWLSGYSSHLMPHGEQGNLFIPLVPGVQTRVKVCETEEEAKTIETPK